MKSKKVTTKERPSSSESSEEGDSVWDAITELETDPDYITWVREVWEPLLKSDWVLQVSAERVFLQWRAQGGLCAATGTVLVGVSGGKGMYCPSLVVVNPSRPAADTGNVRVVCAYVACMHDSLKRHGLHYNQFMQLAARLDDASEDA